MCGRKEYGPGNSIVLANGGTDPNGMAGCRKCVAAIRRGQPIFHKEGGRIAPMDAAPDWMVSESLAAYREKYEGWEPVDLCEVIDGVED